MEGSFHSISEDLKSWKILLDVIWLPGLFLSEPLPNDKLNGKGCKESYWSAQIISSEILSCPCSFRINPFFSEWHLILQQSFFKGSYPELLVGGYTMKSSWHALTCVWSCMLSCWHLDTCQSLKHEIFYASDEDITFWHGMVSQILLASVNCGWNTFIWKFSWAVSCASTSCMLTN